MEYCKNNNLSVDKLLEQELYIIDSNVYFVQSMPILDLAAGLTKDLETQPKTTLLYRIETDEFEQTEYTDKYLYI